MTKTAKLKRQDIIEKLEIQRVLRFKKAQENLLNFAQFIKGNDYEVGWHHELIARKLTEFAQGKIDKLLINVMPQAGKSELSCRFLPAFLLGHNPKENIAIASYSADLANSFNRDVQQIMSSPEYQQLFPDSIIPLQKESGAKRTQHEFRLAAGGGVMSVGIGGPLTGKNVTVGIIDDCIKNSEEALSELINQRNFDWYNSTFGTRFRRKQRILMLFTRWTELDLAGRIVFEQEEGKWEVIKIPAIASQRYLQGPDKPVEDPRTEVGQAMYPPWHDENLLNNIREISGNRTFECLYQQDPTPEEGLIFKRIFFPVLDWDQLNLPAVTWDFFLDTAYTEKTFNDPSAIICCGYDRVSNICYVRKVATVRKELPDLVKFIIDWVQENGYTHQSRIYIENQASGKSVVQSLKSATNLNVINFRFPKADGIRLQDKDKVVRASATAGIAESERVKLIKGSWNDVFLHELTAFPGAKHDDLVDCTVMAILNYFFRTRPRGIRIR